VASRLRGTAGHHIAPVGVVAGGLLVEGALADGSPGQHPRALVGHLVFPEGLQVLGRLEQGVHEGRQSLLGNHDRPADALLIAVHGPAQHTADDLLDDPVVAVAAVEVVAELVGEQQGADEAAHADLPAAQAHLQHRIAIDAEGVEEDLAIGLLDQGITGLATPGQADRGLAGGGSSPAGWKLATRALIAVGRVSSRGRGMEWG
jgi:hypothetical protein